MSDNQDRAWLGEDIVSQSQKHVATMARHDQVFSLGGLCEALHQPRLGVPHTLSLLLSMPLPQVCQGAFMGIGWLAATLSCVYTGNLANLQQGLAWHAGS